MMPGDVVVLVVELSGGQVLVLKMEEVLASVVGTDVDILADGVLSSFTDDFHLVATL